MNRREMMKQSTAAGLFLLTAAATMGLSGCTVTAAEIEADIDLVLSQTEKVLSQIGDTALAAQIARAQAAVAAAEAAWKGGGVVQDIISALNILEIAVGAVPLTAAWSPLVDVIVAGIEFVLTHFAVVAPAAAHVNVVVATAPNDHKGRLTLKVGMLQTPHAASKKLWNEQVAKNPQLAGLKIL